jgi:hypothetical protein
VDNREVLVQTASIRNVLVASLAWSLAAVAGAPGAVLAVTVGLILLMRATRRVGAPIRSPDRVVFVGVVAVVAIALTTQLIRIPNVTGLEVGLWLVLPAALASFGLASASDRRASHPLRR